MKEIFIFFGLVCIIASFGSLEGKIQPNTIENSLVWVQTSVGRGSGFVVKSGHNASYLVTNRHVCTKGLKDNPNPTAIIKWTFLDRTMVFGKIVQISRQHDLCLIRINLVDIPYAKISPKGPEKGQIVYNVGNPEDMLGFYTYGKVLNLRELYLNEYMVQFTGDIRPGASGSPVYNANKEVVGVAAAYTPGVEKDALFVNGIYLNMFLKEYFDGY